MVSMMKKILLLAAAAALAGGAYTAQAAPVTYMSGLGGNVAIPTTARLTASTTFTWNFLR